jgi:hypothetical protein
MVLSQPPSRDAVPLKGWSNDKLGEIRSIFSRLTDSDGIGTVPVNFNWGYPDRTRTTVLVSTYVLVPLQILRYWYRYWYNIAVFCIDQYIFLFPTTNIADPLVFWI